MNTLAYIDILRQIMHEHNLTQQKLADILKVNQTTISQWLLGNKKPSYDNILAICQTFSITPNEFFGF